MKAIKSYDFNEGMFYRLSLGFLVVTSWVSSLLFALYIFIFYLSANTISEFEVWNKVSPHLYSPDKPAAMTGMFSHFFFGCILMILGPIQFSAIIRKKYTYIHRWIGILYTFSAFITGFGGIVFLGTWGAVGGTPMLIGFSIYGLLMMACSFQTIRFAIMRQLNQHRQWAIRLFALVMGSWIYRMGYGFIHLSLNDWGLGPNFSGPLDYFMSFAFFIIPLFVAEIVIKGNESSLFSLWKVSGSILCFSLGALICQGTYYFLAGAWGKVIFRLL